MKKVFTTLVLLLAVVMAQATDYYVVGDFTTWTHQPVKDGLTKMALLAGTTDTYYADFTPLESGNKYFCIATGDSEDSDTDWSVFNSTLRLSPTSNKTVTNGCYSVSVGLNGDKSFLVNANTSTTYRIMYVESTSTVTVTKVGLEYYVAGCINDDDHAGFFGSAWATTGDANKLTLQTDGTYAITYEDIALEASNIKFKIANENFADATADDQTYSVNRNGTFDIKFVFYIDNINGPVCTVREKANGTYKLYGGTGEWTIEGDLTNEGTINSFTKAYEPNYSFGIIPNNAVEGNGNIIASMIIRPTELTEFEFEAIEDTDASTEGTGSWKMKDIGTIENNPFDVTFTYNSSTNKWNIAASTKFNLGATGFATYSNANKYTVTGATANFVTVNGEKTVATLVEKSGVFPGGSGKNNGIILSGNADDEVTITAVAKDASAIDASANLLAGSGNYSYNISTKFSDNAGDGYTAYIFAKHEGVTGFYKWDGSATPLGAHKAFLAVPTDASAPEFISFDFSTPTAIEGIETAKEGVKNVFNLAGQRVAQPTKGLYIVNGKKIVMK